MVTAMIEAKDKKTTRTMEGDAVIAVAIREITDNASGVSIAITGTMRPVHTANALGDAMAEILKELANDSSVPESVLSVFFLKQFLKMRGGRERRDSHIKKTRSRSFALRINASGVSGAPWKKRGSLPEKKKKNWA